MAEHWDVAIIGAGMAGLAAARQLGTAGLRSLILEARNRVGGRVHTLHEAGWPVPIEAGAEFIHGDSKDLQDAIEEARLETHEVSERHWHASGGRLQPMDFDVVWEELSKRLQRLHGPDLSFADFLQKHGADLTPLGRTMALNYVEGFNAADASRVSSRWLAESDQAVGGGGGAPGSLKEGYASLAAWLAETLPVESVEFRLNTAAATIHWSAGKVEIETQSTRTPHGPSDMVHADCAIITAPLGVLQAKPGTPGAIHFEPEVTEKRKLWQRLRMGSVVKIVLLFRERFWERGVPNLAFLHTPQEPFQTWWTTAPRPTPLLTGWVGGPAALQVSGQEPKTVLAQALSALAASFSTSRSDLQQLLAGWHLFDWQTDPFSRGAYSYVPVGELDTPARLAEPVEDTLFFAGEATDAKLAGTVAGAMASGRRAAEGVLQARTRQTCSSDA